MFQDLPEENISKEILVSMMKLLIAPTTSTWFSISTAPTSFMKKANSITMHDCPNSTNCALILAAFALQALNIGVVVLSKPSDGKPVWFLGKRAVLPEMKSVYGFLGWTDFTTPSFAALEEAAGKAKPDKPARVANDWTMPELPAEPLTCAKPVMVKIGWLEAGSAPLPAEEEPPISERGNPDAGFGQ